MQPRSPPLVLPRRRGFLRGGSLLSGRTLLSPPGFRLFSPPSRGAFQLSLTVLVRYRSRDVFRVGSRCLPASRRISNRRYSGTPRDPAGLRLRGYHPLRRRVPADFGFAREGLIRGPCNPTSPGPFGPGFSLPSAVFGRPYSRHRFCFLFLRVLRCFNSPRSPSLPGVRQKPREVPFGNPRFDGCLRLAGAYRSLPRPSSAPRAEPSTGRLSVLAPYSGGWAYQMPSPLFGGKNLGRLGAAD